MSGEARRLKARPRRSVEARPKTNAGDGKALPVAVGFEWRGGGRRRDGREAVGKRCRLSDGRWRWVMAVMETCVAAEFTGGAVKRGGGRVVTNGAQIINRGLARARDGKEARCQEQPDPLRHDRHRYHKSPPCVSYAAHVE